MIGLDLVRALEDDWRDALDAVARSRGWPTSHDVGDLARSVARLSSAYNDPARARADLRTAGAARLGFSFVRDVPKGAAAVRELVATRALPTSAGVLRVLDVGAGLGAMTWGLARALRAAGGSCPIEATWVDADIAVRDVALAIVRERRHDASIAIEARTTTRSLDDLAPLGRFDVVLVGHLLSELGVGSSEEARRAAHGSLLRALLEGNVAEHGALVIVEPALRERTRRLHAVRDELAGLGFTVFAPCLHAAPCPALASASDWCHEDLPVDLPGWLVPVARAAGLRYEGLTFSYLVLRRDGQRLVDAVPRPSPAAPGARLRVVSERIVTKGKSEAFLCGEFSGSDAPRCARARVARLDRDARGDNEAWETAGRGDVLVIDPPPDGGRPRVTSSHSVIAAALLSNGSRGARIGG